MGVGLKANKLLVFLSFGRSLVRLNFILKLLADPGTCGGLGGTGK